jgi:hypothetical protein
VTAAPHFSVAARRARVVHRHRLGAADAFGSAHDSGVVPASAAPALPGLPAAQEPGAASAGGSGPSSAPGAAGAGQGSSRRAGAGAVPPAGDPIADLARDLVVLHATDAASVFLQVAARLPGVTVADVEDALYERRSLVRMLGMRRTVYVVAAGLAGVVQVSSSAGVAATERRKLVRHLVQCGVHDDTPTAEAWLGEIEQKTLAALEARGSATASRLSTDVPELRTQLHFNTGKAYDVPQNITSRVLGGLAASGHIVRGRPRGSWLSTQYEWAPTSTWLGVDGWAGDPREARVALARAWLSRYGPGTVADLTWWTGWTGAQVKEALAGLDTVPVDLDGVPGIVLAGDEEPAPAAPGPCVALLPALDPTVMGWAGRDWYLGAHGPRLFDRTGNAGPTVWVDGRVAGGWAQRPDGNVAVHLLDDVGREAAALAEDLAARLSAWLGPVRVTPKFRTPLERELAAS